VGTALDALRADEALHLGPARPDEGFGAPTLAIEVTFLPDAGSRERRIRIGQPTMVRKERMFFARLDGVDVTYAIARDRISPLLDAL
jgi:hypothetical protein